MFFKWAGFWDPAILSDRFLRPTHPPKSFCRKDWETCTENWKKTHVKNTSYHNGVRCNCDLWFFSFFSMFSWNKINNSSVPDKLVRDPSSHSFDCGLCSLFVKLFSLKQFLRIRFRFFNSIKVTQCISVYCLNQPRKWISMLVVNCSNILIGACMIMTATLEIFLHEICKKILPWIQHPRYFLSSFIWSNFLLLKKSAK